MELPNSDTHATISLEDLQAVTEMGLARMSIQEAEAKRGALVRRILAAESELAHILASHTRCMLVNGQGTPGVGNLAHETVLLHTALTQYARLVHDVAHDRRRAVDGATSRARGHASDTARERTAERSTPRPSLRRAV